jgi:hypothetical protein
MTVEKRDQVQREAKRPPVEPDARYESVTVEFDVAASPEKFSAWFAKTGAAEFASFPFGREDAPGAVRKDLLVGLWKSPGDRRRLVFADDSSALEEIIVDQRPQLFEYEAWNVTTNIARYISYSLTRFEFSPSEQGTHIRWTYSFRPKGWPDGWIISGFVQNDVQRFMTASLVKMRAVSESETTGK